MKEQNKENKEEVINHETLFVGLNEAAMVAYVDAERRKEYGTMSDASDCPTNDEMFLRLQATLLRAWEADKKNKRIDFLRVKYDYENSLEAIFVVVLYPHQLRLWSRINSKPLSLGF